MYISVNKKTNNRRPVPHAALNSALSGGTSSGVWVDEDTASQASAKRTNRIKLTRQKPAAQDYDA